MTEMLFISKVPIFIELFNIFIDNIFGEKYEKRKCRKKILEKEHDCLHRGFCSFRFAFLAYYYFFHQLNSKSF